MKDTTMRNWTEEEKQKQRDAVQKWKPWENSSGPKTGEGMERTKFNATRHGLRSAEGEELRRLMHQQRLLVNKILRGEI